MESLFQLESAEISNNSECFIIAEIAQAHDGSLGLAHAYIDEASKTGVDAVKFQTHIASEESSVNEPWRVKFSYQDKCRYDYWKRMEFTKKQWIELKEHANSKGLMFLSSPFSVEAVKLLNDIGMPAWKLASGEICDAPLIDEIKKTKAPIIISTGMCKTFELDKLVKELREENIDVAVMQCSTKYPCPAELVGLNIISDYKNKYKCPVGLSDHSGTIYPALAAATIGVAIIEVHLTISRNMFGPDVTSSITTNELKELVSGVRFINKMHKNPLDKEQYIENLDDIRNMFFRGLYLRNELKKGDTITAEDIVAKKPKGGISAEDYRKVIGRKLLRKLNKDTPLDWSDLL